ncbi:MAG: cytochrome c oxidase subunit 3 [Candidatus Eremiobacteraeota bacterium]|jgi:cytochrome c oxidase subunit 3|nr:cytochrome c oxidase subunit 3 [Candidatus Eremiobacteraeota bacterium]MCL5056358.1 cytochrome c oxidase subunit 3 [Bacillota bacterium]
MEGIKKMEPTAGIQGLPAQNREEKDHFAPSAFSTNRKKTMMWVFIISDALLFGTFLAVYTFERFISPTWPDRWKIFDPGYLAVMTVVLLSSSTFMATAVEGLKQGKMKRFGFFYTITILCGIGFLGMQAHEWAHFIGLGARLNTNPWGVPLFSGLFFMITGFHGFHVLTGVLILSFIGILKAVGKVSDDTIELAGMYWSFVDLVWVFILAVIYLL